MNRGFRIKEVYTRFYCFGMGEKRYRIQVHVLFGWISIAEFRAKEEAVQVINSLLKSE